MTQLKVFEFAKEIGVETLALMDEKKADFPGLEKLLSYLKEFVDETIVSN